MDLQQSIKAFNRLDGLDWQYFQQNNMHGFVLMLRLATDLGFVWRLVHDKKTTEDESSLGVGTEMLVAGAATLIPVAGQALAVIIAINSIFDFSAFGDISKSGIAVNRLKEFNNYMINNYGKPVHSDYTVPTNYISWCVDLNKTFYHQKPKCSSPSQNCKNEHIKYQAKITTHREAQENCLIIYEKYFNVHMFNDFVSLYTGSGSGSGGGSGGGGGGFDMDNKSLVIGFAVIILIFVLIFVKG